ncbi:hypothetical protein GDO86_018838 [Hymenochirus boettgeri]|uniref:Uncharacterized protein n=1 Tax=Hymenochirus boettgeri TaxID=247094 RepID=A0A8T2IHB5_9PIPI|nr:hypothetical protein GDO86_018838 [Hymenochirus boettgeri]
MASVVLTAGNTEQEKNEVSENNMEESGAVEDEEGAAEDDGGAEDEAMEEEETVVDVGSTYPCKRADGSLHDAEVVKTRYNKQAGREEYYVHYVGLNRRQNEWVEKSRLILSKPPKEEDTNGTEQEVEAVEEVDNKTPQKRKLEEPEPESKKAKVEVSSVRATDDFAEELTCPLCVELFKDPVMIECGHNFCRSCIDKAWEGQSSSTCPECKEALTDRRYTTNRALANLVKKAGGSAPPTPVEKKPRSMEKCPEHDERLKLYCKDDGTLGCVICRDSLKHAKHNFLPILDAVVVYREELSAIVAPMEASLKVTEQFSREQNEKIEQHKSNMADFKEHVVGEFEKIFEFLKERKDKLLDQLNTEGESLLNEMENNLVKMQENEEDITKTINVAKERMEETDSISFLMDIKSFIERCQQQQREVVSTGNTLLSKELCHGTFKGPIQYMMWKEMKSLIVPRSPVTVWIVGNSFVKMAKERVDLQSYGPNLGLEGVEITWNGIKGLRWRAFMRTCVDMKRISRVPKILILHLGGTDMLLGKQYDLIQSMRRDMAHLRSMLPSSALIFSEVIPRPFWYSGQFSKPMERCRRKLNNTVAKFSNHINLMTYRHIRLHKAAKELYCPDKSHLSDEGLDIFIDGLRDAVQRGLAKLKAEKQM